MEVGRHATVEGPEKARGCRLNPRRRAGLRRPGAGGPRRADPDRLPRRGPRPRVRRPRAVAGQAPAHPAPPRSAQERPADPVRPVPRNGGLVAGHLAAEPLRDAAGREQRPRLPERAREVTHGLGMASFSCLDRLQYPGRLPPSRREGEAGPRSTAATREVMTATTAWELVEPDLQTALLAHERPLDALAAGAIPAVVLRGAYPPETCQRLYEKLLAEGLLYDPALPVPEHLLEASVPEGYYREGRQGVERGAWQQHLATGKRRIDIGTSLGYRGSDPEAFFAHAAQTHQLFERLFAGLPSPVRLLYDRLRDLSRGKRVVTAHEPDGRRY